MITNGQTLRLLSGNVALASGAYHAGVKAASAYRGTPGTEIPEAIAQFEDIYAEWSTNEKVALEVARGAASSFLPLKVGAGQECIAKRRPPKIRQINITAFKQGRKELRGVNI